MTDYTWRSLLFGGDRERLGGLLQPWFPAGEHGVAASFGLLSDRPVWLLLTGKPVWLAVTDESVILFRAKSSGLHRPTGVEWVADRHQISTDGWAVTGDHVGSLSGCLVLPSSRRLTGTDVCSRRICGSGPSDV